MKIFTSLISSLIISAWVLLMAIFSIQNVSAVSLKLFLFQLFPLPVGVLLAFCFALGMILGAILPLLWSNRGGSRRKAGDQGKYFP